MPISKKVFLSYSSKDRGLVTPVGKLLRASSDAVFQDCDSIQPGANWKTAIDDALAQSDSMYVFWCRHASSSDEVRKEYVAAIQRGVAVVPVLLDGTPLNQELSAFQGVDFRDVAVHPRFSATAKIGAGVAGLAALLLVAALLIVAFPRYGASPGAFPFPDGSIAAIELRPQAHTFLALGETIHIEATGRDAEGRVDPDLRSYSLLWHSSRDTVAKVDEVGTVTAIGNGDAEIRGTLEFRNGSTLSQVVTIAVKAPWWLIVAHWLRENGTTYGIPLGVMTVLTLLVRWQWRRRQRKHAALATQILSDLQGRSTSPSGSLPRA